jgi:excisionase family DNA binding protein
METKELFTIRDFMSRYSISRSSLYRELNAGRLRVVKRGRRSLITRADAEEWLKLLPAVQVTHAA